MSHSKALIDSIVSKLSVEYPPDAGYEYVLERQIKGTRMMPDVAILQESRLICVAEIGYTRPEKLTAYRDDLHIPDVRWYDKGGRLHADVKEKVITVTASMRPSGHLYVYKVEDCIRCVDCDEVWPRLAPEKSADRFIRRFGADAWMNRREEDLAVERAYVTTWIVTDYIKAWFPSYCDKCARNWLPESDEELEVLNSLDASPRDIASAFGARETCTWEQVCKDVLNAFGLSLDYMDGEFIRHDDERAFKRNYHVAVDRARAEAT